MISRTHVLLFIIMVLIVGIFIFYNRESSLLKECPKWVDCEPSGFGDDNCIIPEGCKDITKKVH